MEEVVGYLYNLNVQVEAQPAPGLVTNADGSPVTAAELLASGPDPDSPGVEQHRLPMPEESALTKRPSLQAKGLAPRAQRPMTYSAPSETGEPAKTVTTSGQDAYAGVGRNAPCPCGSGRKFKMCHGRAA